MSLRLAFLSLCFASTPVFAAGFDCSKAASPVEKTICGDAKLSELDEHLARYYVVALETLPDAATCLKLDQRQWVNGARKACGGDKACLTTTYLQRLSELDGLQPGASAVKTIELPAGPTLVTVVPPETEGMKSKSKAVFMLEGTLRHEQNDLYNMGFAVQPASGPARAFIYDADIGNSPSHETIRSLTEQEPKTRFRVRGTTASTGGFADGDCRYVYRLPQ